MVDKDQRSLKSEYDYNHKKKFVDVLGQTVQVPTRLNGGSGLHMMHLGQQTLNFDNQNYRKDKHSGLDHLVQSNENTQEYISNIKRKPSKKLNGGRFKSVSKVHGGNLDGEMYTN